MADKIRVEIEVGGDGELKFRKLTEAAEEFGDKGSKALGKFSGAFDVFAGSLASDLVLGGVKALAGAVAGLAETLVVDGVRAAIEQEDAINRLNTALVISGQYTEETSKALQEYASQLQTTTKYSDDNIESAMGLIQSLGQLDEDGLKKATKASIDLAAALKIDLQSAAQLVGKAADGNTAALGRYGIKIEDVGGKSEKFAAALEKIEQKFGGAAQAEVNTFSGALALLDNQVGEVKEAIGFLFIENQSLINVLKVAGEIAGEFAEKLNGQRAGAQSLVSEGIVLIIDASQVMVAALEATEIVVLRLTQGFLFAQAVISKTAQILTLGFSDAGKRAQESADEIEKINEAIRDIEKGDSSLGAIQDALGRLKAAAEAGFNTTTEGAARSANGMRDAAVAANELSDAQKKLIEDGVKLAEQAAAKDPAAEFQKRQEALDAAFEAEKISLEERNAAIVAFEEDKNQKISASEMQKAETIMEQNRALLADGIFKNEEEVKSNNIRLKELLNSETISAKDRAKIQQNLAQQSKVIEDERRNAIQSSLGNLASFQNAKSKEIAFVGKAAAIAQATMDTYRGATAAAAALAGIPIVGPALGAAAAATFIAAGIARVAQISGVNLATGITEVPAGFPNDTFAANLTSGERVVDGGTNEDLKSFLANSQQMAPILLAILHRLNTMEMRVNVYIGSRTIIEEVRQGLESGRTFDVAV